MSATILLLTDDSPECLRAAQMLKWRELPHEPVVSNREQFELPAAMFEGATYQGMTGIYMLLDNLKVRKAVGI